MGFLKRLTASTGSTMAIDKDQQLITEQEFLACIASCIQQWSSIETFLGWLLINLIESKNYKAVYAVFYSTTTFENKLKLINNVAQYTLNETNLKKWVTLSERLKQKSKARNKIVHYQMYMEPIDESMVDFTPQLADPTHNTVASLKSNRLPYKMDDLIEKRRIFGKVSQDLFDFVREVAKHSSTPWPVEAPKPQD